MTEVEKADGDDLKDNGECLKKFWQKVLSFSSDNPFSDSEQTTNKQENLHGCPITSFIFCNIREAFPQST